MKKTLILSLVVIIVISLAGCGKKDEAQNTKSGESGFEVTENNTLLGWLKKGKTVECSVETPMGKILMFAQNEKIRMEGIPFYSMESMREVPKAENGVSLTVGDWMYLWDKETKKGTKMNVKEMERLGKELDDVEDEPKASKTWEDSVKEWEDEEAAYNCKEKKLSSEVFEAPEDVEFADLTEMMKGMADFGKNAGTQIKAGGEIDLKALEEMAGKLKGPNGKAVNMNDIKIPE